MKTLAIAVVGTASLVASADAGFLGFVALAKQSGGNVIVDIYTAVGNASDKFLNVYNLNASATGGFYQQAGLATKTWKPDAANFNSTRSSIDSFMTAGAYSGGAYGGEYYASTNTNGDPNFTGTSWSGTPASPAATTIPALAGWYTGDPTSIDNSAESLAAVAGTRVDASGASGANFGIWCAHLVVTSNTATVSWNAFASIKDGVTGGTSQAQSTTANFIPAPGAIALLGVAAFAAHRRRD